ncbi:MAG: amino acid ABC transporter permease [Desulfobacterales bacterium]|nr:MAG: amino acid ABC transporter permease [Desulfobacterales bacterium]
MDYDLIGRVFVYFAMAAGITVELSFLSMCLGLGLGLTGALCKLSPNRWLEMPARLYVSVFRGTPCLIQLFVIYFGGPQIGLQLEPFPAGVLGLGINIGAYMTESIRGAILAVERGQMEAARSLGLSKSRAMVKVILPQAACLMVRPLGVNTIALIKGSSLVSAISVLELTYTAHRYISSTYRPFELFILAALFYLLIISIASFFIRKLDQRFVLLM